MQPSAVRTICFELEAQNQSTAVTASTFLLTEDSEIALAEESLQIIFHATDCEDFVTFDLPSSIGKLCHAVSALRPSVLI